jgi:hypothetical protein
VCSQIPRLNINQNENSRHGHRSPQGKVQLLSDYKHKEKDQLICIPTCVMEYDTRCPGIIGNTNIQGSLVRCLCPCHDNDSEPMNNEQKSWMRKKMRSGFTKPIRDQLNKREKVLFRNDF